MVRDGPTVTAPRDADPFRLVRFLREQQGEHESVLGELLSGRKTGHWIWYVFPQVAGLGRSALSRQFAISGLDEARAYLAHPVLRARLVECFEALLSVPDGSADEILGSLDAAKVRSSATLFHRADPSESVFRMVLERFYCGTPDPRTDGLLGIAPG